ncbi:hypothetical protein IFM89_038512 [Coptis chinensis]|uniref:Uncharacterized protein n=1 Tax=Coptis chinensis TaxID=261450 RepID=A0A835IF05_9MAGN|nr:hypothetical protein IFM89_038512 [Coptis chinensis]
MSKWARMVDKDLGNGPHRVGRIKNMIEERQVVEEGNRVQKRKELNEKMFVGLCFYGLVLESRHLEKRKRIGIDGSIDPEYGAFCWRLGFAFNEFLQQHTWFSIWFHLRELEVRCQKELRAILCIGRPMEAGFDANMAISTHTDFYILLMVVAGISVMRIVPELQEASPVCAFGMETERGSRRKIALGVQKV